MPIRNCFLLLALIFSYHLFGQNTVSIFILDSDNKVDSAWVANRYTQVGFTPSISISEINTTLNTSNFDVVFVAEGYSYDNNVGDFTLDIINENERQIIENYVEDGGHVVWITENWNNYPASNAAFQTINNIYQTNLTESAFFNNQGIGSPNIFRIHPSIGPAGLSPTGTVMTSGSYRTMLNVPNCNKLYTPDVADNSGNVFETCTHTVLAVFPARPKPDEGSIIISSELGMPFKPFMFYGINPIIVYNEELDSAIAKLHYQLIIEENTNELNDWSDISSNMNPNCPVNVASYTLSDTVVCVGDSIFFTHNYDGNVLFYTTQDSGSINIRITNYIINGTCYDDTLVTVRFVNPIIDAGNNVNVCTGDEIVLSAENPSNAGLSWNNGVINNVPFVPQQSDTYIVESTLLGCSYKDSLKVNVTEKAVISLNTDYNIIACKGDQLIFNATTNPTSNINWNNNINNNTPFTADSSADYYVQASIGNCISTDSIRLTVLESPIIEAGNDQEICIGQSVILDAEVEPINSKISWNNEGVDGLYFYPNQTKTYTLTANFNNCISKDSLTIIVNTPPKPYFNVEINYDTDYINTYYFQNATSGGNNNDYLWNFGDNTQSNEFSPTHNYDSRHIKFANVTLYIQDEHNCLDSISKTFKINENVKDSVFVPSAFTPNGDQDNELFIPIFNISPREYDFSIYTRWGQRIFNSTDPKLGWNGKYNNKLVQNGIYSYKLLFNRKSITGTFTVMGEQ